MNLQPDEENMGGGTGGCTGHGVRKRAKMGVGGKKILKEWRAGC